MLKLSVQSRLQKQALTIQEAEEISTRALIAKVELSAAMQWQACAWWGKLQQLELETKIQIQT